MLFSRRDKRSQTLFQPKHKSSSSSLVTSSDRRPSLPNAASSSSHIQSHSSSSSSSSTAPATSASSTLTSPSVAAASTNSHHPLATLPTFVFSASPTQDSSRKRHSVDHHHDSVTILGQQISSSLALSDQGPVKRSSHSTSFMTAHSSTTPRASSQQPHRDENYYYGPNDSFLQDYHHHQHYHLSPHDISTSSLNHHNDLYANLEAYSFGAPGSLSSSSSPGNAYLSAEDISPLTQRTPRPSVVVQQQQHASRSPPTLSNSSAVTSDEDDLYMDIVIPPPREQERRPRERVFSDTASHHTFGPRTTSGGSSSASSIHFSSEDESNVSGVDDQGDHSDGRSSPTIEDKGKRKASLPMDIPSSNSALAGGSSAAAARDREDSLMTLRRPSRSLDDELKQFAASRANAAAAAFASLAEPLPQSQPVSKADWTTLVDKQSAAIAVATVGVDSRSSHSSATIVPTIVTSSPTSTTAPSGSSALSHSMRPEVDLGFDIAYILDGIGANGDEQFPPRRPSLAPSFAQPVQRRRSSIANGSSSGGGGFGLTHWFSGGRRTSATPTVDDTFQRFVRENDENYDERYIEWTFRRERADARTPRADASVNGSLHHHHAGDHHSDAGASTSGPPPPFTQELWWSPAIGRYKVDSVLLFTTDDTTKPPQQRLNIINTKLGPNIIVHKHSRASAFTILRTFQRHRSAPVNANFGATSASTPVPPGFRSIRSANGIMLAPRRVQEQYTSTKSTIKLSTHGLLNNNTNINGRSTTADRNRSAERDRKQHNDANGSSKRKDKDNSSSKSKDRGGEEQADFTSSNSTVASASSTTSSARSNTTTDTCSSSHGSSAEDAQRRDVLPPLPGPPILPPPPQSAPHSLTHRSSLSTSTDGTLIASNNSIFSGPPTAASGTFREIHRASSFNHSDLIQRRRFAATARRGPLAESDQEDDYDDEDDDVLPHQQHTRTPHAEAFNTLDADRISEMRARAMNQLRNNLYGGSGRDGGGGGGGGVGGVSLRRIFFAPSGTRSRFGRQLGGPGQYLDGTLPTPWLMTAPRSMQEESERQVMGMDSSFRTVGLLPSSPAPSTSGGRFRGSASHSRRSGRKQSRGGKGKGKDGSADKSVDVFELVPEDSLYMLLPMWVGETDSETREQLTMYEPAQAYRQYLLVYYVPFDEKAANKSGREARDGAGLSSKKKQKGASGSTSLTGSGGSLGGGAGGGSSLTVGGTRGAGDHHVILTSFKVSARLVSYDELRDSGMRLPSQGLSVMGPLKDALQSIPSPPTRDDGYKNHVIGVCHSRERGVELVPEGFNKVGLCLPAPPPQSLDGVEYDPVLLLSPLGLAVVEMAWAGCMALTSFVPNPGA